jgi:hypothetical protein
MENHVDAVDQDPRFTFITGGGEGGEVAFFAKLAHLIDDGPHLRGAGAGGDDEKVGYGRQAADIQDDHVAATGMKGVSGRVDGELTSGLKSNGGGFKRGLRGDIAPPIPSKALESQVP